MLGGLMALNSLLTTALLLCVCSNVLVPLHIALNLLGASGTRWTLALLTG